MAFFDEKLFNAEAFGKYVERVPNLKRNELLRSRAIRSRQDIAAMFSDQTGGNYGTVPLFGLIGGEPLNYDGATDNAADMTKTFSHSRVVVGRQKAWREMDFSVDISGGVDFMDNVVQQVAEYWDAVDQNTLLSILKGVFNMTGGKNGEFVEKHTLDVTGEGDGLFTAITLNNAIQKASGDNKQKFSLVIMHSQVATNLENLKLLSYMKGTDSNGIERELSLATLNGRLVLIDDSMPVEIEAAAEGSTERAKYTTYVLGDGAVEYTDCKAEKPYNMTYDPAKSGGITTLYTKQRKIFAPYGINFTKKSMKTLSPTSAELENGLNWELVNSGGTSKDYIDHRAILIARIISRG